MPTHMDTHHFTQACRRALLTVALLGTCDFSSAFAQQVPGQSPFGGVPAPSAPTTPSPSIPALVETAPLSREAQLEERVRQLEAMVNRLSTQMQPGATG